jgi:serine/threonine protein kinase
MSDIEKKYLKYKQKYINLKEIIGGGIDASYIISGDKLTLKYKLEDTDYEIKYTLKENLGKGSYGIVKLIEKDGDTINKYIFKKGKKKLLFESYNEGIKSNMLDGILDPDMLVLFQGKESSDFLISTYNGNDLSKEFKNKKKKIKDNYATTTIQLLELLYKINSKNIFHNDIKVENATIKDNKVYLIDFGFLTSGESDVGSLISMSYMSVITFLEKYNFKEFEYTYPILKTFLKNTDIIGFFYCCIDLLFLYNNNYDSSEMLHELEISDFTKESIYNLFILYYFILPTSKRIMIPDIDNLSNEECDPLLPSSLDAKSIFGDFSDDNTNLFRFMTFIYNKIKLKLKINETQQLWYIEFLKIMSTCFLPDFDYVKFIPIFNEIVSKFSK